MFEILVFAIATVSAGILSFVVCYVAAAWAKPGPVLIFYLSMIPALFGMAGARAALGFPIPQDGVLFTYIYATIFISGICGVLGWSVIRSPQFWARLRK